MLGKMRWLLKKTPIFHMYVRDCESFTDGKDLRMKTARRGLLLVAVLASLLAVGLTLAQSATPGPETAQTGATLHSLIIGASGGTTTTDTTSLHTVIGQSALAGGTEGSVTLRPGFGAVVLNAQTTADVGKTVYVPMVYR
jgi:hypothetical protein